jgi:hypothetical protein
VKRVVARQRFLPFWRFLEKDEKTPKGGLLLHWFFAVVFILATPVNSNGYNFVVGMDTYGQLVIVGQYTIRLVTSGTTLTILPGLSTLGLALMLRKKAKKEHSWATKTFLLRNRILANLLFITVILANSLTLVVAALGYKDQTTSRDPLPGWLWPAVTSSIFGLGALYGLSIHASSWEVGGRTVGSRLGFELNAYRPKDRRAPPELAEALKESELDDTRRRLHVKVGAVVSQYSGDSY